MKVKDLVEQLLTCDQELGVFVRIDCEDYYREYEDLQSFDECKEEWNCSSGGNEEKKPPGVYFG